MGDAALAAVGASAAGPGQGSGVFRECPFYPNPGRGGGGFRRWPHAGKGMVERMAVIGQRITHARETVAARPALASEAERLGIRPASTVLTMARTYHAAERPVETADIVIPVERYSLVYAVPVKPVAGEDHVSGA